jgi:hypothetical protein
MMFGTKIVTGCAVALLGGSLLCAYGESMDGAPFPKGYRDWTVVKGRLIGPKSPSAATGGGFRYIYTNHSKHDGAPYAEGTVFVDERVEATEDANGVFQEGPTIQLGVMMKDKQCADTGGWCFNLFVGDDTSAGLSADGQKTCFTCHAKTTATDLVYSKFRRP